jgi:hypothetical protein
MIIYRRPLHPELFRLEGRRCHRQESYESENWITAGGHVARFCHGGETLTEAVVEEGSHLPEQGLIHAMPCIGEKEFQVTSESRLGYVTTLQTETLVENLYQATYREMKQFAEETGALCHEFQDEHGAANLSVLDAQNYKREYHIQGYHLYGSLNMVLRTQSIFELP